MAMDKCSKCKTNTVKSVKSKWCKPCYKKRRTKQLKDNNVVWGKRVAKKTAGHHVRYLGKPTEWAAENPSKAVALAKKYITGGDEAIEIIKGTKFTVTVKGPKVKAKPQPKVKIKSKPIKAKKVPKAKKKPLMAVNKSATKKSKGSCKVTTCRKPSMKGNDLCEMHDAQDEGPKEKVAKAVPPKVRKMKVVEPKAVEPEEPDEEDDTEEEDDSSEASAG